MVGARARSKRVPTLTPVFDHLLQRLVGFLVLTVPAMTVFGSAVLLPHIVNQQNDQYLLAIKKAEVAQG